MGKKYRLVRNNYILFLKMFLTCVRIEKIRTRHMEVLNRYLELNSIPQIVDFFQNEGSEYNAEKYNSYFEQSDIADQDKLAAKKIVDNLIY